MMKRPFLSFMVTIGILIGGLLYFIESPRFAQVLKTLVTHYAPKNLGIQGNFSELSIRFVPPGFSVIHPEVRVEEKNFANLPSGSFVNAERIDFTFRLFQIFSGNIRVHEVKVINGNIQVALNPPPKKKPTQIGFHWDELFKIKAESVSLQNVRLDVQFLDKNQSIRGFVNLLHLSQWMGTGGVGYTGKIDIRNLQGDLIPYVLQTPVDQIQSEFHVNARGLDLDSFLISAAGIQVSASGQIDGNLIESTGLKAQVDVQIKGDLGEFSRKQKFTPSLVNTVAGHLSFKGKVQGDLEKLLDTFRAEGNVQIENFSYLNWKVDHVEAEGKWDGLVRGGELSLNKAVLTSRETPRIGGFQPGGGGRVEVGPLKWAPASSDPLAIPLRFRRAHVHWLGAGGLKGVYPLDFRLDGNIDGVVSLQKNKKWGLSAQLNSSVDLFQLDNQRYLQNKPLRTLFKVPQLTLEGSVQVNEEGIQSNNLILRMPHSKLQATGKVNFQKGYDLNVLGNVDLSDFGQLSENDIRGKGVLNARIRGPSKQVIIELDADLKDAYYLNLFLGDLKGKMVWDDDASKYIFDKVQLVKGSTHSIANGLLSFGENDSVDLNIQILQGNIQELVQVFENVVKPLDWFPHSIKGPTHGKVKISGGLDYSKLQVVTKLSGVSWNFWGEKFKTIFLEGGFIQGGYYLKDFTATKRMGKIGGRISFDKDRKLSWDIESFGLSVNDIDHIVQLDVPIRGAFQVQSSGEGYVGSIRSATQASLTEFNVRGVSKAPTYLLFETDKGGAWMKAKVFGGQGIVDAYYDDNPSKVSYFNTDFRKLDFSPILLLLNPKTIQDRSLEGFFSGSTKLKFRAQHLEKASGVVHLSEYVLAKSGTQFELEAPVEVKFVDGDFDTGSITIQGKLGTALFTLAHRNSQLEGKITGSMDNSLVEFFTPTITQASHLSKLDFSIGGTVQQPTLFGRVEFLGGALRLASFDSAFENITGSLRLTQNSVKLQNLQSDVGGGKLNANGEILLNSTRYPEISIKSSLNNTKVKVYPFQFVRTSGVLEVKGKEPPYKVEGSLVVDSALCREKVMNQKQKRGSLKALQYSPPSTQETEGSASKFKLNIEVESKGGVVIQNDLFRDVQAKGSLTVINTLDTPRIMGIAEITQGKLLFKDHVFQIQSATASFDNPTVINPSIDLNAGTDINGVAIGLYATGRIDNLKVEFTSNPAMQESEIFSLLALGLTASDARKLNANDLNLLQQGEAASLVLHSLDFNRELEDKTGFQVHLDESVNTRQGASAFRPQSQNENTAAPQITIRKKLGDRLSLSLGSTVGVGTNKSNQVNMDYVVNRNLSISGVFNNTTGVVDNPAATQSTSQSNQNSFGLDIKFQKRFK